jgi:hypothetical protein
MGEMASSESGVSTSWYEYVRPTSISVTRTPEAVTGHDAPVSVDAPELEPLAGKPASPQYIGIEPSESIEPLLEPPLLLDVPPELPLELLTPEPLPEPPLLPELPLPEPLLLVAS